MNKSTYALHIAKPMIAFLIPVFFASVLKSLGQVLGIIVVGQTWSGFFDSYFCLFPLFFFLISFIIGIGFGSSILVGQSYGGGNIAKVKEVVGVTLVFTTYHFSPYLRSMEYG
ncbi:Na+-driven multidrug efflux pump [Bacillus pakistanensis]|uniref:Na+-driven multidrug efflux pump n=1 Tax=Rossellomorea pakistanensis TaxID=992288 RepID=A0ABS2NJV8_9BACI|nr:MATE family efflux transporter [Bacillus pakistanensis]MBM7588142.1 Na+-driven multidrug efflux pump [Bacillus pakistanensis]